MRRLPQLFSRCAVFFMGIGLCPYLTFDFSMNGASAQVLQADEDVFSTEYVLWMQSIYGSDPYGNTTTTTNNNNNNIPYPYPYPSDTYDDYLDWLDEMNGYPLNGGPPDPTAAYLNTYYGP